MVKLFHFPSGKSAEHSYPAIYDFAELADGTRCVVATSPGGDHTVIRSLASTLAPPLCILYILHTPRSEAEPGRYQSPWLKWAQVDEFLDNFGDFLGKDGRHDVWIHSVTDDATVVWDRHNLIYAYGTLSVFTQTLKALGYNEERPDVPVPHMHYYWSSWDETEKAVLRTFEWKYSPLQPEDVE